MGCENQIFSVSCPTCYRIWLAYFLQRKLDIKHICQKKKNQEEMVGSVISAAASDLAGKIVWLVYDVSNC
jgi:hypothetical protein